MALLSVVFMIYIPNMVNAGKNIGMVKNAFSAAFKFKLGIVNENASLFVLYPTIQNKIIAALNVTTSEIVDNGVA